MKGGRRGGWDGSTRFTAWRQEPIVVGKSHAVPEAPAPSWWATADRQGFSSIAAKEYTARMKGSKFHLTIPIRVLG